MRAHLPDGDGPHLARVPRRASPTSATSGSGRSRGRRTTTPTGSPSGRTIPARRRSTRPTCRRSRRSSASSTARCPSTRGRSTTS
jgi:hypothetical protein